MCFFFCYFLFFNAMRSRCGWSFVQTHVRTLITPLHSKHAINFDAQAYSVAVSVRSLSLSTRLTGRLLVAILFALSRFCCFVCGSLSSVLYQYRLWVHPIVVVRFFKLFFFLKVFLLFLFCGTLFARIQIMWSVFSINAHFWMCFFP